MSVVKVIEILAESTESWEAATQDAVNEAAKTVEDIQTVYIESFQAVVKTTKLPDIVSIQKFHFWYINSQYYF